MSAIQWENVDLTNQTIVLNGRMSKLLDGTYMYEDGLKNGDDFRVIDIDDATTRLLRRWKHQQKETAMLNRKGFSDNNFISNVGRSAVTNMGKRFNR